MLKTAFEDVDRVKEIWRPIETEERRRNQQEKIRLEDRLKHRGQDDRPVPNRPERRSWTQRKEQSRISREHHQGMGISIENAYETFLKGT